MRGWRMTTCLEEGVKVRGGGRKMVQWLAAGRRKRLAAVLVTVSGFALAETPGITLVDFASPKVVEWASSSGLSASPVLDSSGVSVGTEVAFTREEWRGLALNVPEQISLADWRGWESVVLEVENREEEKEARVSISFRNDPDTWESGEVAQFYVAVPPGRRVSWPVRIFHLPYTMGWEWPLLSWGGKTGAWGRLDLSAVKQVRIGCEGNGLLGLYGLRLATPIAATGWVDRYGQRSNLEWPLKVRSDQDLKDADRREGAALGKAKVHRVFDEYHAWKDGPVRKATGFFRVEEVDGRWWLVAPNGRLHFMTGIDCMGAGSHPHVDEVVRAAYSWWPDREGPFAAAYGFWWLGEYHPAGGAPSLYRANLIRKRGAGELDRLALARAIVRVLAWQFSSIGNWSDERLFALKRLPYVTMGPPTWEVSTPKATEKMHDPFDPGFPAEARRVARKLAGYRDDPWCIGHFVDNEVDWDAVPDKVLAGPPERAARAHWIAALREKYGTVARLAAAWGISATSFSTLRWSDRRNSAKLSSTAWEDAAAFRGEFADRWFRAWGEAVREADPNHLVLGSRFSNRPAECVKAAGRHMDVVSFNQYSERPEPEEYDKWYELTGKPFLIGEYGFNSLDDGLLTTAVPVANRKERGIGYRYYTEQMAALPYFVGGHYFQWIDEPITGRSDRETAFNGFLKVTDIPDPHLAGAAKKTNPRLYGIHAGRTPPYSRAPRR